MLHGNPPIVGVMGDCSVLDWFINFPFPMRDRVSTLAGHLSLSFFLNNFPFGPRTLQVRALLHSPPHAPYVFWVVISGPASTSPLVT